MLIEFMFRSRDGFYFTATGEVSGKPSLGEEVYVCNNPQTVVAVRHWILTNKIEVRLSPVDYEELVVICAILEYKSWHIAVNGNDAQRKKFHQDTRKELERLEELGK